MISYGPGLVFPDAWGGRPEEELEECEHDWQLDPRSDDFGVCAVCGADRDWEAEEAA